MSDTNQVFAPARMSLTNLSTQETLPAQYNPTEIEEEITANWNKLALLGGSHMPKQFQQTDNHAISFDLRFQAMSAQSGNEAVRVAHARNFLLSLFYPSRFGGDGVVGGAPTRFLFVWPELFSLTCTIDRMKIKHSMFNKKGPSVILTCSIGISEIRDARLYAEDVILNGTLRDPGQNTSFGGEL